MSQMQLAVAVSVSMPAVSQWERGIHVPRHKLRHTFGTEAARASNGNLLVVADMMGHESLTTTSGYTKLVGVATASTVAAMYPPAA